jgi:hypothetical protein
MVNTHLVFAQEDVTSSQIIEGILSDPAHRTELTRISASLTKVLADARLADNSVRQMLQQSQTVLSEMLERKSGANVEKLVEFAKWMHAQSIEQIAIHESEGEISPQQQFVLDNPLAGQEVYVTSIVYWVVSEHVRIDKDEAGQSKLEGYLQLYIHFRRTIEGGKGIPNGLLFEAPEWIKQRFGQLTADQKKQFLRDVLDAREDSALPLRPDEVPGDPRSPQEEAAYEAAYQFILKNTPPPLKE